MHQLGRISPVRTGSAGAGNDAPVRILGHVRKQHVIFSFWAFDLAISEFVFLQGTGQCLKYKTMNCLIFRFYDEMQITWIMSSSFNNQYKTSRFGRLVFGH